MEKILPDPLPEIVFSSSVDAVSKAISRAVRQGRLRKIGPRLYTSNLKASPKEIIKRNRYVILGQIFPGAVLSHRTALEGGPTKDDTLFLTYKYTKLIKLPGLNVRLIEGKGALPGDTPFMDSLFLASCARAFLENMQFGRSRTFSSKSLPI